jgi:hypothetical protein
MWEVEFITETTYNVKQYQTHGEAQRAADKFLLETHPSIDPKVWVRRGAK